MKEIKSGPLGLTGTQVHAAIGAEPADGPCDEHETAGRVTSRTRLTTRIRRPPLPRSRPSRG
jgi:hypothetical protein